MMLPNEILSVRFSKNGKDGYRMNEVDSFKNKVYESFNKVYNENNILNGRVSELNALIQKYNSDKEAIASTLIYAQSTADKTLSEARQKADEIVKEANERAEKEYKDRIDAAEENLRSLQEDYDRTKAELEKYSATYTENINAQAIDIIEKANAKAAAIVAEAKTEADKIVADNNLLVGEAKAELKKIGETIAKLKADAFEVTTKINALTDGVKEEFATVSGQFGFEGIIADEIDKDSIEPFKMPDFSEILAESVDISSGRPVGEVKNTETPKAVVPDVNEYITRIFESVGNDGVEFSSFKDDLTEAFTREILAKGDVSFARGSETEEDTVEE